MPDVEQRNLAVFIDFENLALGFHGRRDRFDIGLILERLVEKGKIVAKKAYADWNRFSTYTTPLHEAAIELVEIPRRATSGKNSADIRLCVDAMDLAYSKEHIDTFVIVSGDSDFSPLVSKLKENGKRIIGLGMQESTSDLLRDNCDEFIYYEDLKHGPTMSPVINSQLPETKRKAFGLLLESLLALRRENKEVLWSSMVKDTMKRKKPSFNEMYHGYRTFSELLEDAQREGLLELVIDKRSQTYVVTRFGSEMGMSGGRPSPGAAGGARAPVRAASSPANSGGAQGANPPRSAIAPGAKGDKGVRKPAEPVGEHGGNASSGAQASGTATKNRRRRSSSRGRSRSGPVQTQPAGDTGASATGAYPEGRPSEETAYLEDNGREPDLTPSVAAETLDDARADFNEPEPFEDEIPLRRDNV